MPTIQTLISAMHQTDHSLLDKMNIQTDAVVVNQCDRDEIERFTYKGHQILWLSLKERGVGLSRNTALMRATADIVLFADEDVCYEDAYDQKILQEFARHPTTDFMVFSITRVAKGKTTQVRRITHPSRRLHWFNVLRYGTVCFAVKRESLVKANLYFHLLFGGGTPHGSGEDSIFITHALRHGLEVRSSQVNIAQVLDEHSTWFKGYTEKYWFDKGVLFEYLFGKWAYPLGLVLLLKNRFQTKDLGLKNSFKNMLRGIKHGL